MCWIIQKQIVDLHPCSGILMDIKCEKVLLFSTCLEIQTPISSALRASFLHAGVSRWRFTWGRLLVSKYHETCPVRQNWSFGWPKVTKVLSILRNVDISTHPPRKLQIRIFLSRGEMTVICFYMLRKWNILWLCPLDQNVDKLDMWKCPIIILNSSILKLIIL